MNCAPNGGRTCPDPEHTRKNGLCPRCWEGEEAVLTEYDSWFNSDLVALGCMIPALITPKPATLEAKVGRHVYAPALSRQGL